MIPVIKNKAIILTIVLLLLLLFAFVIFNFNKPIYNLEYNFSDGKDAIGYVGNGKFQMWHINGIDCLTVEKAFKLDHPENTIYLSRRVLEEEYTHNFDYYGNLYYYSADGYAVIYAENNLCKVFLTDQTTEKIQEKNLVYLNTFDEFTEHEQKQLNKLKKRVNIENAVHDFIGKLFGFSE